MYFGRPHYVATLHKLDGQLESRQYKMLDCCIAAAVGFSVSKDCICMIYVKDVELRVAHLLSDLEHLECDVCI